jgi:hypothetical protein
MMRKRLIPLAALTALAFAPAARADSDQSSGPAMERMQHWAGDHEAFLDAKLAGLKAGLRLTPDQDKLWPPFEAAVRDAAKLRMDQMQSMMERMQKMHEAMMQDGPDGNASPIDRLEALGKGMSARGAAIEKVADAAKPLYASLDDSQKRRFALLGRHLMMIGHPRHGMMHEGMGMMREGMMGHGGMMDRPDRVERMEGHHDNMGDHDDMDDHHDQDDHDSDDD